MLGGRRVLELAHSPARWRRRAITLVRDDKTTHCIRAALRAYWDDGVRTSATGKGRCADYLSVRSGIVGESAKQNTPGKRAGGGGVQAAACEEAHG
jgi:hypothetical protein